MKKKILAITAGLLTAMALTACGKDPKLTQFKGEIDAFCTEISDIDTAINNVDAESDTATDELLGYLDQLDTSFQNFAELDFPTEFDYLESLADEASAYMTQAVESYHEAYSNGGYNQLTADYAKENYYRCDDKPESKNQKGKMTVSELIESVFKHDERTTPYDSCRKN